MDALEFFQCYYKMCASYVNGCAGCEAQGIDCELTTDEPEKLVAAVERWAKAHPEEAADATNPKQEQKYIVRADRAGVFFGEIESRTGSEVTMRNVRRIWRWEGANSLSQLAVDGTKAGDRCKFSVAVESMTILGVIEIIPCTAKATKSISEVQEWRF